MEYQLGSCVKLISCAGISMLDNNNNINNNNKHAYAARPVGTADVQQII
jgi:hypothetical protein